MNGIDQLNVEERRILQAHCKAVAGCRTDEERAKALTRLGWDQRRVRVVGNIYAKMRRLGVYVSGVDDRGQLLFGKRAKSQLDEMVEQHGAEYEQRGIEMLASRGIGAGVLKRVEG